MTAPGAMLLEKRQQALAEWLKGNPSSARITSHAWLKESANWTLDHRAAAPSKPKKKKTKKKKNKHTGPPPPQTRWQSDAENGTKNNWEKEMKVFHDRGDGRKYR